MANYARKSGTGPSGKTVHSTTAPSGSETARPSYDRCKGCERTLVPDGAADGTQFVFTTASGPSCPSCSRNPDTLAAA